MKKIRISLISLSVILILIMFFLFAQQHMINSRNLYAKEAQTIQEAQQDLNNTDLSVSKNFDAKDFYGEYIKNTSFVITYEGRVLYDQGYYMVYKENYKPAYCIDPLKTAWSVTNKDDLTEINNHEYSSLTTEQQQNVSKLVYITQGVYEQNKNPEDLVAGQLLIWQAIGAELNDYSANLDDNMKEIESLVSSFSLDDLPKGGTGSSMIYYDTSGQDLVSPEVTPEIEPTKEVAVNKTSDATDSIENGQKITYKLEVTNNSDVATDVTVQDPISDPNLKVNDAEKLLVNSQVSSWTIKDLRAGFIIPNVAAGDTVVITYTAIVDKSSGYTEGTGISNTATACIEDICDDDLETIDVLGKPKIEISKAIIDEDKNNVALPGENLTFSIVVKNSGESKTDVVVKDELNDPNIEYDLNAPVLIDGEDLGNTVQELNQDGILVTNVEAGQTVKITFEAKVAQELNLSEGEAEISNNAVACDENDDCSTGTGVLPTGGLEINKSVSDENANGVAEPGEKLDYTITIINQSSEKQDVTLHDKITGNNTIIDLSQLLIINPIKETSPKNATLGDLESDSGIVINGIESGETVTVQYSVLVKSELDSFAADHINNTATACINDDCETGTSTITTDPENPVIENGEIGINKSMTDENNNGIAEPGEKLTFDVIVSNQTNTTQNVTVSDKLSDENINYDLNKKLEKTTGSNGEFINPTSPIVGDLVNGIEISVEANSYFEFKFDAKVKSPLENTNATEVSNIISACTEEGCTDGGAFKPLEKLSDYEINKTVTDASGDNIATEGELLTYNIEVSNVGNETNDIAITDELPSYNVNADLTQQIIVDPTTTEFEPNPATIENLVTDGVTIKNVLPGQTVNISFNINVSDTILELSDLTHHITNIANVCYVVDENTNCESDSATITTDPTDVIPPEGSGPSVIKTMTDESGDGVLSPGEKITFNFHIVNNDTNSSEITITDPLADKNINYAEEQQLVILNNETASFIGNSTVGDLKNGVVLSLGGNQTADVTFDAQIKQPLTDTTAVIGYNTVEVCAEELCSDGGALKPIESNSDYSIEKDVTIGGNEENIVAVDGDIAHYVIKISNTGNEILENLVVTDNNDDGLLVPQQDLTIKDSAGNSVETTPTPATSDDLFGTGVTITQIPLDGYVTIEYDATVTVTEQTNENDHFSNIAEVCIENLDCKDAGAGITINPDKPIIDNGINLVKSITDASGDGIAEPGEELTFAIEISNEAQKEQVITVTDLLENENVNYDLTQNIVKTPDTIITTPENPTVGDLKTGIETTVPAEQSIKLTFTAKVKTIEEGFDQTQTLITNVATACTEEGCTDGGGHIVLPSAAGFDLEKSVSVNGTPDNNVAVAGDSLEYKVTVINTKNTPIKDITITDINDDGILVPTQTLSIKFEDGRTVQTTPQNPTTDDLFSTDGIIINSEILPGERINIEYTGTVASDAVNQDSKFLTNIASACTPNPNYSPEKSSSNNFGEILCADDKATVTTDPESPVIENGIGVVKSVVDENENNIGEPGEKLTFSIKITNEGTQSQQIKVTDPLDDPNLDYTSVLQDKIIVTPADGTIVTIPTEPVVGDLKSGIDVTVGGGKTATLEFSVNVFDPLVVPENSTVTNIVTACTEEGCTDGGIVLPLIPTKGFNLTKTVDVLDNDTTDPEWYVVDKDTVHYVLTIENNRNTPLKKVKVTDFYDNGIVVPTQELTVTSSTTELPNLSKSTTDDLFSTDGIEIDQIDVDESITLEYDANISVTTLTDENVFFTNTVEAETDLKDYINTNQYSQSSRTGTILSAAASATVSTDINKPVEKNKIDVVKEASDDDLEGDASLSNGDGIASEGERITFTTAITNSGDTEEVVTVTDKLEDVNINYADILGDSLTVLPETTVTNPSNPTVGDLDDEDGTSLEVTVPAGQTVKISFEAYVLDPLKDPTQTEIANQIVACDSDGYCPDGGGTLPLIGRKGFDLTKTVEENGNTENLAEPGESLHYKIQLTNNRNRDLTNLNVTDIHDDEILVPLQELIITTDRADGSNPDQDNPDKYTTDQLFAPEGIILDELKVGEILTIEYDANVVSDLSESENTDLTNYANACTDPTVSSKGQSVIEDGYLCANDSVSLTTDPEKPITEGFDVVKTIVDSDKDGIATPGEILTFNITVTNTASAVQTLSVFDALDDVNIDYVLTNSITVTPSDGSVITNPENPVVGDLKDVDQDGTSLELTIPAGGQATLSFEASVKDPLGDTTVNDVANNVLVCDENDDCNDGGGSLVLPDTEHFSITKTVNPAGGDTTVEPGEKLQYYITVENTGNTTLNDIVVTDNSADGIITSEQKVLIDTTNTNQNTPTTTPVIPYLHNDLFEDGISIDALDQGKKVTFKYNAKVSETLEPKEQDLTNIATACMLNPAMRSEATIDPDNGALCAEDSAKVTTDPNGIENPDIDVVKKITEASGNNEVEPGELLTFTISLQNKTKFPGTYTVTDPMTDVNVDYNSVLNENLIITPSTTVVNPSPATVEDLKAGLTVEIPANDMVEISFTANAFNPFVDETKDTIANNVTACEDGKGCTDGGGTISVKPKKNIEIEKTAVTVEGDLQVAYGEQFKYQIRVKNMGNQETNINLTDDFPYEYLDVDTTQTLDFGSLTTVPTTPTVADLLTTKGIEIQKVQPGKEFTIEFLVSVKDPLLVNGENYNGSITNFAEACTLQKDKTAKNSEDCANANANVTTDGSDTLEYDFGIRKNISDPQDDEINPVNNGDNIANPDETLKFTFKINNQGSDEAIYVATDEFLDPNVDYDSALDNPLEITEGLGTFAPSNPNPTVKDLKSGTLGNGGVEVIIPAGDYIEFTFYADVLTPLKEQYNDDINNELTVCQKDIQTPLGDGCNSTIARIELPDYERMSLEKTYTSDQTYTSGETSIDYVSDTNQDVNYTITMTNNGTKEITQTILTDDINDTFYNVSPEQEIVIKQNGVEIQNNGSRYTIAELEAGITLDLTANPLDVGDSITVEFTVQTNQNVLDGLDDGEMIPNVADVCYNNLFTTDITDDKTCVSGGTETPFTKDPTVTPPEKNETFTIIKDIVLPEGETLLKPGATTTMNIYVTNDVEVSSPLAPKQDDLMLKITDDFIDPNLNYATAMNNPVTITNETTGETVEYVPNPALVSDLDSSVADNGIEVTIPDGETIKLSFEVNANSQIV